MTSYLKVATQLLSSTSLDRNSLGNIYHYLIFCSTSGLYASSVFSLDYGSLPAACMSSNFYYKLDIVNNVRSWDFFILYGT